MFEGVLLRRIVEEYAEDDNKVDAVKGVFWGRTCRGKSCVLKKLLVQNLDPVILSFLYEFEITYIHCVSIYFFFISLKL